MFKIRGKDITSQEVEFTVEQQILIYLINKPLI